MKILKKIEQTSCGCSCGCGHGFTKDEKCRLDEREHGHEHQHSHGHEHGMEEGSLRSQIIKLILSGVLFAGAIVAGEEILGILLSAAAFLPVGGEVLLRALVNIRRGRVFDENFLMALAACGAFALGEYQEAVAVMLFYQTGELLQDIAVSRSRQSIADLMDIRPDFAHRKEGDAIHTVHPETVQVGDLIVVKPGERIPLDGVVVDGFSTIDTASITGESLPREAEKGTEVMSGTINQNGMLTVQVKKIFRESAVARILELVERAEERKAPTESFITRFARYYTPGVVGIALLLAVVPPLALPGATFSQWIYRALIFLVASCPCALLISIPLGFIGGIGAASRKGILLKGGNYLEALQNVAVVVLDKTGTLTKGSFAVQEIRGENPETLLEYAALAEWHSNHPIASSVKKAFSGELRVQDILEHEELPGFGARARIRERNGGEKELLIGNLRLMENMLVSGLSAGIKGEAEADPRTVGLYLALDGEYMGQILIADEVKEDARETVQQLRREGVQKIVMLTGDRKSTGEHLGRELGLDEVFGELLPDQKAEILERLKREKGGKGSVVFVGDGINDAPAMLSADIGIAMGGIGSDAAIEAADIVLMTDELKKLPEAVRIARRTKSIVWQNIILTLVIKVAVLSLGAFGLATMWEAVFADVGAALLAVANSARALQVKRS